MSRSYKKTPICKDHTKGMKTIANRKVRRKLKNPSIHMNGKSYKKMFCSYDICDWIFLGDDFNTYYKKELARWKDWQTKFPNSNEKMPTKESCRKEWLKMYINK